MSLHVLKPGALTTLQDLGRLGYQRFGVSVSGAMDERSHRLANYLVGNAGAMACLEITLLGPSLRVDSDVTIAITGADLRPELDGVPVPLGAAVCARKGSLLHFGQRRNGARAYLAVRGGFAAEAVLGSCSTNVRAGFGGFNGHPLRKGDTLALAAPSVWPDPGFSPPLPRFPAAVLRNDDTPLRIVCGREWDKFTPSSQHQLLTTNYRVSPQSDRMGYRLTGSALHRAITSDIWSETVPWGTVQVPPDGQPIILMTDRGTSGGYPRIANVITVDLARLAQTLPGDHVRFELTTLEHAHQLFCAQAQVFAHMTAYADTTPSA